MDDMFGLIEAGLDGLATRAVYAISTDALRANVVAAQTAIDRLFAYQAAVVQECQGRGVVRDCGAASPSTWLRDVARVSIQRAHQAVALGALLDQRPDLSEAVQAGDLTTEQALAIGRVIGDLPNDSGAAVADGVITAMIGHSRTLEPAALRSIGDRVLAHVAPDVADEILRKRLEGEERRATRDRSLTLSPDGSGRTRLRGILDKESAAILTAAFSPLMEPIPTGPGGSDPRTPAMLRADALVEVCRLSLRDGGLPIDGGQPPQLNITIDFDALRSSIGQGRLDTGEVLSAATVRRIACDCRILPCVLGSGRVPIDVGRNRRLYAGAVRTAVILRDGGCAFPGCDRPPRWTEIHHIISWIDGGPTNRDNGVALCRFHHNVIHRTEWNVVIDPGDRRPWFIPPAHIDPTRTPLRNVYHRRT